MSVLCLIRTPIPTLPTALFSKQDAHQIVIAVERALETPSPDSAQVISAPGNSSPNAGNALNYNQLLDVLCAGHSVLVF